MLQPILKPETAYHIYTHVNGFENLFNSEENYRYFLKKYTEYILPVAETYAYCLMPNHFHFAIKTRSEEDVLEFFRRKELDKLKNTSGTTDEKRTLQGFQTLGEFSKSISRQFSHLFNAYTQAFNKMYNRKGSLFTQNFKRKEIKNEFYMAQLIAYIHNNPVHHGFVRRPVDWQYSSFQAYVSEKSTSLNREFMLHFLGTKEAFVAFHKNNFLPEKLLFEE